MRSALSDSIEYFEADLTGFTTIRGLREAMKEGKQQNATDDDPVTTGSENPPWIWQGIVMRANSEVSKGHPCSVQVVPWDEARLAMETVYDKAC